MKFVFVILVILVILVFYCTNCDNGNRRVKFFREHPRNKHADYRFAKNDVLPLREVQHHLYDLLRAFQTWTQSFNVDFWLDYGSALGAYRHEAIIPWDDDVDVGMLERDMTVLPTTWQTGKYLWEKNPHASLDKFDEENTVAGRFICKQTGIFIDVFTYRIKGDKLYNTYSIKDTEKKTWMPAHFVYPLRMVTLGNDMYKVPQNLKEYLMIYYNNDLSIPPQFRNYTA